MDVPDQTRMHNETRKLKRCYNVPIDCRPLYYTGNEATPTGYGRSPRYEPIGTIALGNDNKQYMVGMVGVNLKKWIYMWWEE